ncbi:porin [Chitinimonas sp.]|uniref:porin n=1 Tax=Chitinimonas sp. TaxID=1934313 RepID=UPI002F957439
MNKKLIALAVSAAAIAPAAFAAENTVTLYGQVNVAVQSTKIDGGRDQFGVGNMASRIGFKGQEDLGGGSSAFFQIETGVAPDDASQSRFASREGWLGLKGDFGSIKLGRGKSLYTLATEEFDPWYQDQSLGLTANSSNYRVDNAIRYELASGPFSLGIENSFGENKTSSHSASNDMGVSAKYTGESFFVVGAVDTYRPITGSHQKRAYLGGSAALGNFTAGLAVQRRDGGDDQKFTDPLVSFGYTEGNLTLILGAIVWDKDSFKSRNASGVLVGNEAKTQGNFAGYYALSKRTTALIEYSGNYAGVKNYNVLSVGLSHLF